MAHSQIDILQINSIYFSSFRWMVHSPYSLAFRYVVFFARLLFNCLCVKKWILPRYKKLVFVTPTLNNKKSLQPIYEKFPEGSYTILDDFNKQLPYARIYFYSLLHIFDFQRLYRSLSNEDKRLVRTFFNNFILTYGTYIVIDQILRKNQTKVIVFANDHITVNRCIIEVAAKNGVKTLYTQHASVTERFPSLKFTYSFLDGMDSYLKYKECGPIEGRVFLSGNPRFDVISKLKGHNITKESIGVALNALDNIEMVKELCDYLKEHVSMDIVIRPHPGMEQLPIWGDCEKAGYFVSYPSKENSFEFVSRVKLLIANESGIHLDANMIGTPSVLYNFSTSEIRDWYSYVKNGLMPVCNTKEEVLEYTRNDRNVDQGKVRYYNAAVGTQYEGKVSMLLSGFIKSMLQNTEMNDMKGIFRLHGDGCYHYS